MAMLKDFKKYAGNSFLYGVCYYPEHWDDSMWDDDFRRMREMGMNVVRMGESAWNIWEPEEGIFSFELFDKAISLCERHGLKVILGTPTYAPPAWLTSRYPEVLRTDFYGNVMQHGSRRHYNYTSPIYIERCKRIVTALAEHYQNNGTVIGWQIDNELNCHMDVSFSESDNTAFRNWCMEKYKTLEALNNAWGTAFWAQTYTAWDQVSLPRPTPTYHNPSHLLDFYRFTSDMTIRFAKMQYDILKKHFPDRFITHNGIFENIDNYRLTEESLDFMSYDSYPGFPVMLRKDAPAWFRERICSHKLSRVRGYSSKFIVLEQQSGPGGQSGAALNEKISDYLHYTPKPGQMSLWAWQSIAHGADGLLFFRWRTCPFGSEMLWHGLNHYGNQPNWRLDEAKKLGNDISKIGRVLLSSSCEASAAIVYDYDNTSNCRIDGYVGGDEWKAEEFLYQALNESHIPTDVISFQSLNDLDGISKYKVLFLPNAQLLDYNDVKLLKAYAEQGGILIFGPRSGYRDRRNQCHMLPFPGVIRELAGIEVTDFTMADIDNPVSIRFEATDKTATASVFNEVLEIKNPEGRILATYLSDYYAGKTAAASVPAGKGQVVYFGTFPTVENMSLLLESLDISDPVLPFADVPREIEAVVRKYGESRIHIFLNYTDSSVELNFKKTARDLLTGEEYYGIIQIKPYGVIIAQ